MDESIPQLRDNAIANHKRIETTIKNKREELEQLEKQLLVAQGRKEVLIKLCETKQ